MSQKSEIQKLDQKTEQSVKDNESAIKPSLVEILVAVVAGIAAFLSSLTDLKSLLDKRALVLSFFGMALVFLIMHAFVIMLRRKPAGVTVFTQKIKDAYLDALDRSPFNPKPEASREDG
jgi:hypothetical protein